MDENLLTGLESSNIIHSIVAGTINNGKAGRLREGHVFGHLLNECVWCSGVSPICVDRTCPDSVAGLISAVLPSASNDTRAFATKKIFRNLCQSYHNIKEIHTCCLHLQFDLIVSQWLFVVKVVNKL